MKKLILAAAAAGTLLGATGAASGTLSAFQGYSTSVTVWTDPYTRCQYLIYSDYKQGGITPRMRRDGTQACAR